MFLSLIFALSLAANHNFQPVNSSPKPPMESDTSYHPQRSDDSVGLSDGVRYFVWTHTESSDRIEASESHRTSPRQIRADSHAGEGKMSAKIIELSTTVLQGHVLFAKFEFNQYPEQDKILIRFEKKNFPCYEESENTKTKQWYCLIGIPVDSRPGNKKLKIMSGKRILSIIKTEVISAKFPMEPLSLSEEKKSLLFQTDRENEIKKIREALHIESPKKLWDGKFTKPVEGIVESLYGEKRILDGKLRKGYHRGVDMGTPEGTSVLSSQDGKVVLSGKFTEEGNMVMIDHGQGIISAYFHLSEILVSEGQTVKKGEIVGKVGTTGVTNTPHLHFGIYIHGVPIDPFYWLKTF